MIKITIETDNMVQMESVLSKIKTQEQIDTFNAQLDSLGAKNKALQSKIENLTWNEKKLSEKINNLEIELEAYKLSDEIFSDKKSEEEK